MERNQREGVKLEREDIWEKKSLVKKQRNFGQVQRLGAGSKSVGKAEQKWLSIEFGVTGAEKLPPTRWAMGSSGVP